ncbi:DUF5050 domain-containing protein, partial [bacterium]|nr:DUF5050 domain-containing protein [bacterium]
MRRLFDRWWRAARANLTAATLGVVLLGAAVVGSGMLGPLWAADDGAASGDASGPASLSLTPQNATLLDVADGWIYYGSDGLHGLCADGTDQSKLHDGDVSEATVSGEWMYLVTKADGHDRGLFRMRTDGTQAQHLAGDRVRRIRLASDWVYFLDHVHELSRVRLDGAELVELSTSDRLPGSFGSSMSIDDYEVDAVGGFIYFLHDDGLYRMPDKPDGGAESELLLKGMGGLGHIQDIVSDGLHLYVVGHGGLDSSDDGMLGRIRLADLYYEDLCDLTPGVTGAYQDVSLICVQDERVYYNHEGVVGCVSLADGLPVPLVRISGEC